MKDKLLDLTGKTALITGGGSGIGKAVASLFAEHGAEVIIVGKSEEKLKTAQEEILSCSYYAFDFSRLENITSNFEQISKKHSPIDILINNAGIYLENSATHKIVDGKIELNQENVYQLITVNMLSYWHWSILTSKQMKERKDGVIINISSVNGISGKGVSDIYDMTKAAINNLTLNQALQLSPYNIRVNAICPSSTITPMRDKAMAEKNNKEREEFDAQEAALIPLGRLGKSEDIAKSALYLASEMGSYVTGQIISIDGGFLLTRKFPNQ